MPPLITVLICLCGLFADTDSVDIKKLCSEESTNEKTPVTWPTVSVSGKKVLSNPLCLTDSQELVTRECTPFSWSPKHDDVPECHGTQSRPVQNPCPPNYSSLVDSDNRLILCYQQTATQGWNFPCLASGSSITIFDLEDHELSLLIKKLDFTDRKLVWLPARRIIPHGPIVWTTVGDEWGEPVDFTEIAYTKLPIAQSCLLLDLDKMAVKTDNCSYQYPSLCVFKDDHLLRLHCPDGYAATRYQHNTGRCYGIETHENGTSWEDFIDSKCKQPLQISENLENHLIEEISKYYEYDMEDLCWTSLAKRDNGYVWYPNLTLSFVNWDSQTDFSQGDRARGALNEKFRWILADKDSEIPCMACQVDLERKEVDIVLQYSDEAKKLFLTIYNQRYLWREDEDDVGMKCFTNARGFVKMVEIDEKPHRKVNVSLRELLANNTEKIVTNDVEKAVYGVQVVENEPGEYWCEGHGSLNFERINSSRVLVANKNLNEHIFVLKLEVTDICGDLTICNPDWNAEADRLLKTLQVDRVRVMEVESITQNGTATVLYHATVPLGNYEDCNAVVRCNIARLYNSLQHLWTALLANEGSYNFLSLRSTAYCLPIEAGDVDSSSLNWEITTIGDNAAPKELCMQSNGLPVTRQCGGSFLYGGIWRTVVGECSMNYEPTNRTTLLYNIAKGQTDTETLSSFLAHDMINILDDKENMIPADVYFLSLSLKTIVEISDQNSSMVELGDTQNIATAVDSIMNIEESCLNLAQTMNSSNVLLESLDVILSKMAQNESDVLLNQEKGVDLAITPQFVLQISNPSVSNVTGLALVRRKGVSSPLFTDMDVVSLTANATVAELTALEDLEVATWVPMNLIGALSFINASSQHSRNLTSVIIDIFYNDVVFQETKSAKDVVNSRVISVTMPGYESDLPLPLPIIYRRLRGNASVERNCAYWEFSATHQASMGEWSRKGCYFVASYGELDLCACFHLTNFAQLITGSPHNGDNQGEIIILQYHGRALNAITLVGCSLSLVGVAGIGVTAILFKTWRQKPGTKVLLHLSAAVGLQSIMIVSQDGWYESETHCIILGAMLHYSVLAAFTWMLLTALLQFARYVKVLGAQRPARFMMKFSLAGWGLPLIPVITLLLVDCSSYLPHDTSKGVTVMDHPAALCYPQGAGLYFSVLLPVVCIIVTNSVVFVLVMRSVMYGPDGKRRTSDPELVLSQLRLFLVLFFLLGLSWIFGLLAATGGKIIFSYLFCLTATLQGFVMFVYFVICDPATRVLWVSLVVEKSIKRTPSFREATASTTASSSG